MGFARFSFLCVAQPLSAMHQPTRCNYCSGITVPAHLPSTPAGTATTAQQIHAWNDSGCACSQHYYWYCVANTSVALLYLHIFPALLLVQQLLLNKCTRGITVAMHVPSTADGIALQIQGGITVPAHLPSTLAGTATIAQQIHTWNDSGCACSKHCC